MLHDLAEVVAGDITPYDGISAAEKRTREEEGLRQMLSKLQNVAQRDALM